MRRLRTLILAALMVGGFVYATSRHWGIRRLAQGTGIGQLWSGTPVVKTAGLGSDEVNNIEIYKSAHLATVNISSTVYRQNWFMQIVPDTGTGSGFLLDDKGHILTNAHVVSGRAPKVIVTLSDKSKYDATVLARDPQNDLALLQVPLKK